MKFTAAIVSVLAVAVSAISLVIAAPTDNTNPKGLFRHAEDAKNGLYTHTVGPDGSILTQYHGEHPSLANVTQASVGSDVTVATKQRRGSGVNCQSLKFTAQDAVVATNELGYKFDSNSQFSSSTSYVYGTAIAYGCDYGNGQRMTSTEFHGYISDIINQCGSGTEGYFNLPSSKSSYGLTNSGDGFC